MSLVKVKDPIVMHHKLRKKFLAQKHVVDYGLGAGFLKKMPNWKKYTFFMKESRCQETYFFMLKIFVSAHNAYQKLYMVLQFIFRGK